MRHETTGTDTIVIAPKAQTNSATTTANIDTAGADFATIRITFKAELNTNAVGPTISLLESDDTTVSNFATVVANRTNEDLVAARALTYHVDLRGRKRYLRLSVTTPTATNDDLTYQAVATLFKNQAPRSTTGMVGSTNDVALVI